MTDIWARAIGYKTFGQHNIKYSHDAIIWSTSPFFNCVDQMSVGQMVFGKKTWTFLLRTYSAAQNRTLKSHMSTQLPKLDFHFVEKIFPIPPMSTKMKLNSYFLIFFENFFFAGKVWNRKLIEINVLLLWRNVSTDDNKTFSACNLKRWHCKLQR